mmetsp:Transcript_2550/g.5407  ORF Transcript_2550/g.5407 Transcript_2550/m.5407 type:complete len:314 (+) Transcript_2550:552-1493(+)
MNMPWMKMPPTHHPTAPSNFLYRKACLIAMSRQHAFPPSKCPTGKLDDIGFQQQSNNHHNNYNNTAWIQSYDWTSEGILPSGWLEKHARALPSAVVVVTSLKERLLDEYFRGAATTENDGPVERHVVQAVEDLRMTLADKRMVPIHLVCLLPHDHSDKDERESHSRRGMGSGGKRDVWMEERLAALREKICQECYLPQSQVTILKYPQDLEKDEWEEKVRRSPYLPGAPRMAGVGADGTSTSTSTARNATSRHEAGRRSRNATVAVTPHRSQTALVIGIAVVVTVQVIVRHGRHGDGNGGGMDADPPAAAVVL